MSPAQTANEGPSGGPRYRFGEVVVDASAHTLLRAGEPQTVEPKAFAVLLVLLQRAGELVGRDELMDAVWGHRHVTPGVLTRAIAQLRHALDDDSQHPRYIQTQHALGYRFIGLASSVADTGGAETASETATARRDAPAVILASFEADPQLESASDATHADIETFVAQTAPLRGDVSDHVDDAIETAAVAAQPATGGLKRFGTRRTWLTAAALLALIIAIGLWQRRESVPARLAEASIAVLPFASLSDDRNDSYFAEGLAVEMHDALARVPGLKVVASAADGNDQARDPKAIGLALGVATVLDASVRRENTRMRISARLSDSKTGFTLWTQSYDRETADVFALQSEIASKVVGALLDVLPSDRQALAKRLTPTRNITAYDAYLKGMQQLQKTDSEENLDSAIAFFREALAIDPAFARAQAGICRAQIDRFEAARDAAAFKRAQTACTRATSMDPSLREVSLALGEMYRARGDSDKAIEQYTRALDDIALRPAAYVGLARTQGALGRNELALDYFERARKLRPGDASIYRERGYHQYVNGDLSSAIASFRTATTLQPEDERQWSSLGGLYVAAGDTGSAADAFQRSLAIKPSYPALSNSGLLKYEAGAYTEAVDLFRRAAELDPEDYRIWGNIGDALSALPATAEQAHKPYRRAADMAERYIGIKSDDAQALALLCWYRANLGDAKAAKELLARAELLQTEHGEVAFLGAQALALLGDAAGARERLARARQAEVPMSRIRASPVLRRLLGTAGPKALETSQPN